METTIQYASTASPFKAVGRVWQGAYEERKFKYGMSGVAIFIKIEELEHRQYQFDISRALFSGKNTEILIPVDTGKTVFALFAAGDALAEKKKALIIANQKPLAKQIYERLLTYSRYPETVVFLHGEISPKNREALAREHDVIVATPDTILNDIAANRISLERFKHAVFDESHEIRGESAPSRLGELLKNYGLQITTLTATPESVGKTKAMVDRLGIKRFEIRDKSDKDISKFIKPKTFTFVEVEKSDTFKEIEKHLKALMSKNLDVLREMGFTKTENIDELTRKEVARIRTKITKSIQDLDDITLIGRERWDIVKAAKSYHKLNYMQHPYYLFESQGYNPLQKYMQELTKTKKSKSFRELEDDSNFMQMQKLLMEAIARKEEHPKIAEVINTIKRNPTRKIMVFANICDTVNMIVDNLKLNNIEALPYMGRHGGMSQEKQAQTRAAFETGNTNVIVSTSIGQQGIDIASVGMVMCWDINSDPITYIQRGGRAREFNGNVMQLITKGTADEKNLKLLEYRMHKMSGFISNLKRDPQFIFTENKPKRSKEQVKQEPQLGLF
jgi:ERCC4-related helicase